MDNPKNTDEERLAGSTLCEVVAVDESNGNVKIRVRREDNRWIVEAPYPLAQCPPEARMPGGAFYLDRYEKKSGGKTEFIYRGRAFNP